MRIASAFLIALSTAPALPALGGCSTGSLIGPGSSADLGPAGMPDLALPVTPDFATPPHRLPATGTAEDTCGPTDGPAVNLRIGIDPGCPTVPGAAPQILFFLHGLNVQGLARGQTWSALGGVSQQMNATWMPSGPAGNPAPTARASIRVLETQPEILVHWEFVTTGGVVWAGEATLAVCPTHPLCG